MIRIHNSTVTNLTDKEVRVVNHFYRNGRDGSSQWPVAKNARDLYISLRDFPQADHDESVGQFRIDFTIQGESQYGVCSIWTNWNRMYYSTQPGHYVASPDRQVLNPDGLPAKPLESPNTDDLVVNFTVTILNKRQIMVQADVSMVPVQKA